MGFLIHIHIAGNIDEFYSMNKSVASFVIKLNRRYKLKVVHTRVCSNIQTYYKEAEQLLEPNCSKVERWQSWKRSVLMSCVSVVFTLVFQVTC